MPWDIFVRSPVKPTLPTLHSGEELQAPQEPPHLHRSPSSLERALDRVGSAVLEASRSWHDWRDVWHRRRGTQAEDESGCCSDQRESWSCAIWSAALLSSCIGVIALGRVALRVEALRGVVIALSIVPGLIVTALVLRRSGSRGSDGANGTPKSA